MAKSSTYVLEGVIHIKDKSFLFSFFLLAAKAWISILQGIFQGFCSLVVEFFEVFTKTIVELNLHMQF